MRRFTNEGIVLTLPEGMSTCDIGSLTVWCRQAGVIFGQIDIPRTTFVRVLYTVCMYTHDKTRSHAAHFMLVASYYYFLFYTIRRIMEHNLVQSL